MKTQTAPCKLCRGQGMVRYGKMREGFKHTYIEVARECPDCDGRGELAVSVCPVDSHAEATRAGNYST